MMTLTIEIPALDRLCGILEDRNRWNTVDQLIAEIVKQLEAAAKNGTLEKAAKTPAPETTSEPLKAAQEPPKDEPTNVPDAPAGAKPVTLADVQKAAAQMRDDGKLEAVKALFPDFGIRKLSDLKGDALQGFAARLREMGARI